MSIVKRGYQRYYSSLRDMEFTTPEAAAHYEAIEQAKANGETEAERALNSLPLDQLKALTQGMIRLASEAELDKPGLAVVNVWLRTRPEYKNHEANKKQLVFQLNKYGLWPPARVEDIDAVFVELANGGLLDLDQKALKEKKEQDLDAQAEAILAQPSEEEMYSMPLDDLKRRARGTYIS
jgi:hypothetical protein